MKKNRILSLLLALVLVFSLVACSTGGSDDTTGETVAEGGASPEAAYNEVNAAFTSMMEQINSSSSDEAGSSDAEYTTEDVNTEAGTLKGTLTVQAEEGWADYYQAAADKIMAENPEANIEIKVLGSFDHLEIINNTDTTNADVADVYALPADQFTSFVENDYLAALPAVQMGERLGGFGNIDDGLAGNLKVNGEYLAFPYNIETLITFVNTANAEAAGVDTSQPIEVSSTPHEATVLLPMFDAWYGVAPNLAGGIELLAETDNGFESTYTGAYTDLDETQKAVFDEIFNYWSRHNAAGTTLFDADAGWGYIDTEFTTGGNGVARIGGPWDAAAFQEQAGEGNLEILPIGNITIAGQPLLHWQGGWTLVANARIEEDADKMALAVAMIEEIVNPENAVELYKATGKILENVEASVYENSDLSDTDKLVITRVLESYEVSTPRPLFTEFGNVWDTWKNAVLSWNSTLN